MEALGRVAARRLPAVGSSWRVALIAWLARLWPCSDPAPHTQPVVQWEDAWAAWKQQSCPAAPLERPPAEAPPGAATADLSERRWHWHLP